MKKTKKLLLAGLSVVLAIGMLTGCGSKSANEEKVEEPVQEEVNESAETEDTVEEAVAEDSENEEGNVTNPFLDNLEKYDSIISTLTADQYYGFAPIGEDYDALLVTDGVYDYGDGIMATIDAKVYGFGNDGKIYEAGSVWSDGTAYPLAVYDDKYIMFGGNHHMSMASVKDGSVVIAKEADEVFDEQGNATYSYNEGNIDDIKEVSDDSILKEMYEMYSKTVVINFFPGGAASESEPEMGAVPSNDFEERVGKTSFESYDEIIGLLEGDEAYALVDVKGYDGKVLLVATYTYDDQLGHLATTECTPYTVKANGECSADSSIYSGGTATPVKMDKDGVIYTATHISVEKCCYGDNGTDNAAIMVLATVSADELDDNGMPKSVFGFIRNNNSLIDDDMKDIESNEIDTFDKLFDDYNNAEEVSFTKAK